MHFQYGNCSILGVPAQWRMIKLMSTSLVYYHQDGGGFRNKRGFITWPKWYSDFMGKCESGRFLQSDFLAFWVELDKGDLAPKWCKVTRVAFVTEDTKGVKSLKLPTTLWNFWEGMSYFPKFIPKTSSCIGECCVEIRIFFSAVSECVSLNN